MENLKNNPFPYCHLYNVLVGNNYGHVWMKYVLHCDYPKPTDKRNIAELKKRLSWSRYLHIYKVNVIKKDYVNGNSSKKTKGRESTDRETNTQTSRTAF